MNAKLKFTLLLTFSTLVFLVCNAIIPETDIGLSATARNYPVPEIYINEVMASNGSAHKDGDGDYEDWIELYNPGAMPIDLSGYYLSDDYSDPLRWKFPSRSIIAARGYMVVWASGKDKIDIEGGIHTNFSISREGEPIILTSPDQSLVVDYFEPIYIPRDVSYGRKPDGSDNWVFFDKNNISPGRTNNHSDEGTKIKDPDLNPVFFQEGGYYRQDFDLHIIPEEGTVVYYTLDGSEPTTDSKKYESPIRIKRQFIKPGHPVQEITEGTTPKFPMSFIKTNPEEAADRMQWHAPEEDIFKATVVRAVAYDNEGGTSEVVTQSYFIDPNMDKRYTFPVISLAVDINDLFDFEKGIYVPGKVYADKGYGDSYWGTPNANYHQRGREWERPVHIEFFEPGGIPGFSINGGVRIHGMGTRVLPQKSLRLYTRMDYDTENTINYNIFPGLTKPGSDEPLESFRRLILRNGGQDFYKHIFRDAALQSLISHLDMDSQASRPCIVFINGEYWGIHIIRERFDLQHLAENYDIDQDDGVILTTTGRLDKGEEGDDRHYRDALSFVRNEDMSDPDNYEYIETIMDLDNYINYTSYQVYIGNYDWPSNNVALWRYRTEYDPDARYGLDGRWRWMVFDVDYGFGFKDYSYDNLSDLRLTSDEGSEKPDWSTRLFRGLIENEEFKHKFINNIADLMNSIMQPERVIETIDYFEKLFEPEIQEHIDRWNRYPRSDMRRWRSSVNEMREYALERPQYMLEHLNEAFGVSDMFTLTLDVSDEKGGTVKINYLEINEEAVGEGRELFPWSGDYFIDVPVEITAMPNPGYSFEGWEGFDSESEVIDLLASGDTNLTALFQKTENETAKTDPTPVESEEPSDKLPETGIEDSILPRIVMSGLFILFAAIMIYIIIKNPKDF